MEKLNVIGQRLPMIDAAPKAKGTAQFTDDIVLPGMLYGRLVRSPYPHAKVISVDTSRAEKLPGVKGVVNGKDIPDRKYGIVPKAKGSERILETGGNLDGISRVAVFGFVARSPEKCQTVY